MQVFFESIRRATRPLQTGAMPPTAVDEAVRGLFAVSLVLADHITIPNYGPNTEIVALFRWLPKGLVERLLEDGTVRFAFAPGVAAYISRENVASNPAFFKRTGLQQVTGVGPDWEHPLEATVYALGKQTDLPRAYRRRIGRLVKKTAILLPARDLHDQAFETTKGLIGSEEGRAVGLGEVVDPETGDLQQPLRQTYLAVAHAHVVIEAAARSGCDHVCGDELVTTVLANHCASALRRCDLDFTDFHSMLRIEALPDLAALLDRGALDFQTLLSIRNSENGKRFRDWLGSIDRAPATDVLREYSQQTFRPFLGNSIPERVARVLVLTGIGAALGPGVPGLASGMAIGLFEQFLLEKLRQRWHPRVFIDELKRLTEE